jgi:putative Flp pilus-assembly TadE/G-like protein
VRYLSLKARKTVKRRAVIAVLTAFLLTFLLGLVALSVDGGLAQDEARRVKAAADAAALAGATELFKSYPIIMNSPPGMPYYDPEGRANAAALASATTNGFGASATCSVTVNIPPKSGPFSNGGGNTDLMGYIEVIIAFQEPRHFSSIWGSDPVTITSRSVARGRWRSMKNGILVLDPSAKDALDASGQGSATVTGGASVIVDSNNAEAARGTGNGGMTATEFDITGGYTGSLYGNIYLNQPPTPDPLRNLPVPPVPPDGTISKISLGNGNFKYTLTPGRFNNSSTNKLPSVFNVGDIVVFKQASANANGGIFYIDGDGFKSTGASLIMDPLTTGGMMIYNNPTSDATTQQIQITGNSAGIVNLSALTSGPYKGILLWENRTSTVPVSISGGGDFTMIGTFYAANAQLQITGQSDATIGSQYISRTLTLSGGGNIKINYTDDMTAKLRDVILVE